MPQPPSVGMEMFPFRWRNTEDNGIIGFMETELYFLTTKDTACIPEDYFRKHFPLRLERSERYRFEEDRLRCLGVGVLLWEILKIREEDLLAGPQGKPYVSGDERKFNISHSGDYIVLAVSDTEVGVDIELMNERHLDVAERVYTAEELDWMRGEKEPEDRNKIKKRFFRLWTLKESVMKACGKGFLLSPESFSVMPLIKGRAICVDGTCRYAFSSDAVPGYGLAVCCTEKRTVKLFRMQPKESSFDTEPCQF